MLQFMGSQMSDTTEQVNWLNYSTFIHTWKCSYKERRRLQKQMSSTGTGHVLVEHLGEMDLAALAESLAGWESWWKEERRAILGRSKGASMAGVKPCPPSAPHREAPTKSPYAPWQKPHPTLASQGPQEAPTQDMGQRDLYTRRYHSHTETSPPLAVIAFSQRWKSMKKRDQGQPTPRAGTHFWSKLRDTFYFTTSYTNPPTPKFHKESISLQG